MTLLFTEINFTISSRRKFSKLLFHHLLCPIFELSLENPDIHLAYLTPTWLLSLRQYLSCHNMSITVSDSFKVQLMGPEDAYIMQSDHLSRYSAQQHRDINYVRIFLQVFTLADLADASNRKAVQLCYVDGKRPPDLTYNPRWPRQHDDPTKAQIRLWRGFIKSCYLQYIPYWKQSPVCTPPPPPTPIAMPSPFADLFSYLESLPAQWQRRLMDNLEQVATDDQVFRAFRSRKRLNIASDGGLALTKGTHGWVIALRTRIL